MSRKALRGASFRSVAELSQAIDAFIAATKTSLDILALQVTQAAAVTTEESYTSAYPRTVLGIDIGG
jgi:hypothetical protein